MIDESKTKGGAVGPAAREEISPLATYRSELCSFLWPQGFAGAFDWPTALIALAAEVALLQFKRGVIEVLAVCALLGMAMQLG